MWSTIGSSLPTRSTPADPGDDMYPSAAAAAPPAPPAVPFRDDVRARAACIPLRLTARERGLLDIVRGALDVSEYTENVDVSQNDFFAREQYGKHVTILDQICELLGTLLGLNAANADKRAARMVAAGPTRDNADFFRACLEVGRRYKIMNPDKMRHTYGKLLYLLMDARRGKVRKRLEMDLTKPVVTVASALAENGLARLLGDPLLETAAREIVLPKLSAAGGGGGAPQSPRAAAESAALLVRRRERLAELALAKRQALEALCQKYTSDAVPRSVVEQCVHSISDHYSFLRDNRGPVERMLHYLKTTFSPRQPGDRRFSLQLSYGQGGSKLSHSHQVQYQFVLQTLTLWRNIMDRFFELWLLAEDDLLSSKNGYKLANTGQGIQRCQGAPRVARAMSKVVGDTKREVGSWVGLSVVHLGDRDVPNALVFIDKYTQVRRILAPLASTLDQLDEIEDDPNLARYVRETFGDVPTLRKLILSDFFKHGFDGSGDDGGSCIDGRLTSCWNWCSKLEKKAYYPVFMLTGWIGFDGKF